MSEFIIHVHITEKNLIVRTTISNYLALIIAVCLHVMNLGLKSNFCANQSKHAIMYACLVFLTTGMYMYIRQKVPGEKKRRNHKRVDFAGFVLEARDILPIT